MTKAKKIANNKKALREIQAGKNKMDSSVMDVKTLRAFGALLTAIENFKVKLRGK